MRARLLNKKWSFASARQFRDASLVFVPACDAMVHFFGFVGGVKVMEAVGVAGVIHECCTTKGVNILWSNAGERLGMEFKTSSMGIC